MQLFLGTTVDGLQMGLCFAILALGVYISYSILDFPDLSVDGSFPLGGVTCTILMLRLGMPPLLAILLSFVATLGACGASGVAGGSLLLIPMACSLLGIGQDIAMQVVAVGFIIGVVQDSLETAINSSGDVIFCATAEYRERLKRGEDVKF